MKRKEQFPFGKIAAIYLYILVGILLPFELSSQGNKANTIGTTHASHNTPELVGDGELCLLLGRTIGTYSAGGSPEDVYEWTVTDSAGEEIFSSSGGEQFETIQVVFSDIGEYEVSLKIRRGTNSDFYQDRLNVTIQKGPDKIALQSDYLLCGDNPVILTALDAATPDLGNYSITWRDIDKNVLGTDNELLVYSAGIYFVELYLNNDDNSKTCAVNGTTYVGPAVDFKILKSKSKICEGGSVQFSAEVPLAGEWFIRKKSESSKISLGSAYELELLSSDLSGPGIYEVSFSVPSLDFPDCPSERKTEFEILQAPQVDIRFLDEPDQCDTPNGSFQILVMSNLESISIPELDFYKQDIAAGEVFTFENLKPRVYLVQLVQNGCVTNELVQLKSQDWSSTPPTGPDLVLSQRNESCAIEEIIPGNLNVTLSGPVEDGMFRILSSEIGVAESGSIPVDGKFDIDLKAGSYLLEITIGNCTYPIEAFTILGQPQVAVSVPSAINICESYLFVPETSDELLFTLTFPNGDLQSLKTGEGFTLTEAGSYTLLAEPLDENSTLCPKRVDFTASLLSPFSFSAVRIEENCFDPIRYRAELKGITANEVTIRWFDSDGIIVGRSTELYPPYPGEFSLSVMPISSGFCPTIPVAFEFKTPITQVPMDLGLSKSCEDREAIIISLATNPEIELRTEWIYYDQSGEREELHPFDGLFDVHVYKSGTYEAVAYTKLGCEVGRNLIQVEVSEPYPAPELEPLYPVCSKNNSIPPIDPGEYAEYEWYFGEQLVSSQRLFKPDKIGNYQLSVTTEEGCVLLENFSTHDVCDFKVVFPNAMILGHVQKNFRVFISEDITDAELFVLNRQGELIHHVSTDNVPIEAPVFIWDGKFNGQYVPVGNYAFVVILRNPSYGIEERETGSLLVLQ